MPGAGAGSASGAEPPPAGKFPMVCPSHPPTRAPHWRRHVMVLALASLLAGCANNNLGELRPTLIGQRINHWLRPNAIARGSSSQYALTDDERTLRTLARPLIAPPYDRRHWYTVFQDYGRVPNRHPAFDRAAYFHHLMASDDRSASVRYAQLLDDVRDDRIRLPEFFETATRVRDMDDKRRKSLALVSAVSASERADALSRIDANERIVRLVRTRLRQRISGYRFALERLAIMTPSPQVAQVEQALDRLQAEVVRYRSQPAPTWHRQRSLAWAG